MALASVIIPNWNGKALLKDCLESLKNQTFKDFEVIVVDNGSTDGSVEYINKFFPRVKQVKLNKNYGFAKAINAGVKHSLSRYVIFLNNDTTVERKWLKELTNCAKKYSKALSINSKILNFYNRKTIDGVGIEVNEVGQARSTGWGENDIGQYSKEMEIFGATGGASIFDRRKYIKLNGFDEDYFMYSEEVDLAFRAQFKGFRSYYCPKAVVYHKHKATAKKMPQHVEYWQFKNMTQTIIKDMPIKVIKKDWRWLKIILVHINTILYQLKNGFFWPPLMTELWLLANLPKLLYKRRRTQVGRIQSIEKFLVPKRISFWGIR